MPQRGPDFICIGCQKSATRWLYDQLANHPGVWMPPVKELSHFVNGAFKDTNLSQLQQEPKRQLAEGELQSLQSFRAMYDPKLRDLHGDEWYLDLFAHKGERVSGDISPEYCRLSPETVERVSKLCPRARFILLVRDPVERFWSAANMHARRGKRHAEELESWPAISRLLARGLYLKRSFPSRIWSRWNEVVPGDRIRFFFFDDIRDQPSYARKEIFSFLGISTESSTFDPAYNMKANSGKIPLDATTRKKLARHFLPEYERCAEIFGGHARSWLDQALRISSG